MYTAFSEKPIQVIAPDGTWHSKPVDVSENKLTAMYWDMVKARMFDEKLVPVLRQGKTSFYSQSTGMEATQIGLAHAMRPGHDWLWPYYRDQALVLALGVSMKHILAQFMGVASDECKGRQMPHHFSSKEHRVVSVSSSIANQIAPATGMAMAQKYLGLDEITVCTFGDGATSEGDWHAGVNMAAVNEAPILFVCENNQYAISAGLSHQMRSKNVAIKGQGYGIPGYFVDGQDILAVFSVMQQAAEEVRSGKGPVLVECLTYRIGTHSSADDDSRYRPREEVDLWRNRDPITRFERFLERQGLMPTGEIEERKNAIRAELDLAVSELESEDGPLWDTMFEDVYSDFPIHLQEQYKGLEREHTTRTPNELATTQGGR